MHDAATANATNLLHLLLGLKADPSIEDKEGRTPLQCALDNRADAAARILLSLTPAGYREPFMDSRFDEGRDAYEKGDLARAVVVLEQLIREDPANGRYNFTAGMVYAAMNEHGKAQLAFQRVLSRNPSNSRARSELARSYMASGQLLQAEKELLTVLEDPELPRDVRFHVRQYLKLVQSGLQHATWSIRMGAGAFHDDNVNAGPEVTTISIAPTSFGFITLDTLTVNPQSQPLDAAGYFVSGVASLLYDWGAQGYWMSGFDVSYFQNWMSDASDYEIQSINLSAGIRRIFPSGMLRIPLKYGYTAYGHNPLVQQMGISPVWMQASSTSKDLKWMTMGSIEQRDYDSLITRDGWYYSLSETLRYRINPRGDLTATAGLFRDQPDDPVYRQTGFSLTFRVDYKLPWKSRFYGQIKRTSGDFDEPEVLMRLPREDVQNQLMLGLARTLWAGTGIDASIQRTENNSTFDLYQYERNVLTVSGYWNF